MAVFQSLCEDDITNHRFSMMNIAFMPFVFILCLNSILCSCSNEKPRFELLSAKGIGIDFVNQIDESDSINMLEFTNIYNGAGVGIGDFNNDSRPDLFFCGNMVSSKLYLNRTKGSTINFEDVTVQSGVGTTRWATGVSVADINSDGLLDIYVSVSGSKFPELRKNYLFVNEGVSVEGIPVFADMAEDYGLACTTYSSQAVFFDYDLDSDLDLFVAVNYPENLYGSSMNELTSVIKGVLEKSDRLYENRGYDEAGQMIFEDVSEKAGIIYKGYSLGISAMDINEDGWPDIYLSNDFLSNDIIYINNQDGTFDNKIGEYFKHTTFAGMGCDVADYNNDGLLDIAVLDMIPDDNSRQKSMLRSTNYDIFNIRKKLGYHPQFNRNTLQLNNGLKPDGNMSFSEIGRFANIHYSDWSWSILFADLNNSGWKDLFISNGYRRDMQNQDALQGMFDGFTPENSDSFKKLLDRIYMTPEVYVPNRFYKNMKDLTFSNVSQSWGIKKPSFSSGASLADFDDDGDLDLVVSNLNESPHFYLNHTMSHDISKDNNYLKIHVGDISKNRQIYGSKIMIEHGGDFQYTQFYPVHGYLSSADHVLHFGLGEDTVVQVRVEFPDNTCISLPNVQANQTLDLSNYSIFRCGKIKSLNIDSGVFFKESPDCVYPQFEHREDDFNDFEVQPLIHKKYSQMGPGIAIGDIDKDELDDFFVGGGINQSGAIYRQTTNGFVLHTKIDSENFEDLGALFFDADNDGDKDLYVVAGGVEYNQLKNRYADRLFINDGRGGFMWSELALPKVHTSGFCVNAVDFDADGDLDLFIGGHIDLKKYPYPPKSYLLLNESQGGRVVFKDVTDEYAPELSRIGMVRSSLWTDANNDGHIDLMLVGEWMPITLFQQNEDGQFKINRDVFDHPEYGWWNSINGGDFDKDGDVDYVCGNFGLNSAFKASIAQPIELYAVDLDNNGTVDPLMFQYWKQLQVPVHPRDLLLQQIPSYEHNFVDYDSYAEATIGDFDLQKNTSQNTNFKLTEFQTVYLENRGKAGFMKHYLNKKIQISPVKDTNIIDIDGDGNLDLIVSGNMFVNNYTSGPIDASIGYCLLGRGNGKFDILDGLESGLMLDKDISGTGLILGQENSFLIAGVNNSSLLVYNFKQSNNEFIRLDDNESWAWIYFEDGKLEKREFYYSKGYLSSSARTLRLTDTIVRIEIFDFRNKLCRAFDFSEKSDFSN